MAYSGKGCSETNNSALVHVIVFFRVSPVLLELLMALPVKRLIPFGSSSVKDSYFWQLEAQKEIASFREAIK